MDISFDTTANPFIDLSTILLRMSHIKQVWGYEEDYLVEMKKGYCYFVKVEDYVHFNDLQFYYYKLKFKRIPRQEYHRLVESMGCEFE